MVENSFTLPYCPLYGTNVVISEYNENGQCKCLSCNPFTISCKDCDYREKLISARISMVTNKCIQCYTMGAKNK